MSSTIIDFLRHGEPVGGSRYRGHRIDDPLSELGWRQMRAQVKEPVVWTGIVSSPMERCLAFARDLSSRWDLPLEVEERLKEVGFGDWSGLTREEVRSRFPDAYRRFYGDPLNERPAGAEKLQDFVARVGDTMDSVVSRGQGQHLLLTAHAGVVRAALVHTLSLPLSNWYQINVDYAAMTRFRHDERGYRLDFHNLRSRPECAGAE